MLERWAVTALGALEQMSADIRARRLVDDTLERDMDWLRHLMGRREIIVNEILLRNGPHRGPGTPLYREIRYRD